MPSEKVISVLDRRIREHSCHLREGGDASSTHWMPVLARMTGTRLQW